MSHSALQSHDAAFEKIAASFLDGYWQRHPVIATGAGLHTYDDRFPDMSAGGRAALATWLGEEKRRIAAVSAERLNQRNGYDRLLLLDAIDEELFSLTERETWRWNPMVYTHLIGNGIFPLLARENAPASARFSAVSARVRHIPEILAAARANLTHPPRLHTETVIRQNDGAISLLTDDLAKAADRALASGAIAQALRDSLREATAAAMESLHAYGAWLRGDLLPRSTGDYRVTPALYARELRFTLHTDLTPAELLARAEREYARVRREMFAIAVPLHARMYPDHAHGPLAAGATAAPPSAPDSVVHAVVREVLDRLADSHPAPDSLLDVYRTCIRGLEAFVRERRLVDLPDAPLAVIWTPAYQRGVANASLDSPGPLEPQEKAFFNVAPLTSDVSREQAESFLREYNDYMLQILCIHEAVPGHYVQGAHARRYPSVIASVFGSRAFAEGWAVYTERMMLDEGYGGGDPALRLHQLKFYLRTVCNTILDIRLHTMNMTDGEVRRLLVEGAFQENAEAEGKIRRAKLTETQLCEYFTGAQEIFDLREAYKRTKGAEFRLADFHNALLAFGNMPVRYLREILIGRRAASARYGTSQP
jgi:uncharacterized protein (DUF885 family)